MLPPPTSTANLWMRVEYDEALLLLRCCFTGADKHARLPKSAMAQWNNGTSFNKTDCCVHCGWPPEAPDDLHVGCQALNQFIACLHDFSLNETVRQKPHIYRIFQQLINHALQNCSLKWRSAQLVSGHALHNLVLPLHWTDIQVSLPLFNAIRHVLLRMQLRLCNICAIDIHHLLPVAIDKLPKPGDMWNHAVSSFKHFSDHAQCEHAFAMSLHFLSWQQHGNGKAS